MPTVFVGGPSALPRHHSPHGSPLSSTHTAAPLLPNPTSSAAAMLLSGPLPQPTPPLLLPESSGEDGGAHDHDSSSRASAPKKRAETWVQDETLSLIALRREMDNHFNTSKSNKHLWEAISAKMREQGFDRSPTMCTDKWRNLLKEFKKARSHARSSGAAGGNGSAKMAYYKEIDDLLKRRGKAVCSGAGSGAGVVAAKSPAPNSSKIETYLQFTDKGFEDANIPFGPVEASGRSLLSVDDRLEPDRHPLALPTADAVATNGMNPWNWRDTSTNDAKLPTGWYKNSKSHSNDKLTSNSSITFSAQLNYCGFLSQSVALFGNLHKPHTGGDHQGTFGGRVIVVNWGDYTKRIGIDGTAEAIKEAIKSAFGLRTRRAFWLEDEDEVVRSLDRDMPVGTYMLHLDNGITIKLLCTYDAAAVRTEEKAFYTEDDFRDFLSRRGWTHLREYSSYRFVDTLDDLRPGVIYQGMRSLVD